MFLDKLAVFADAQTTTTNAASTDIVDTLAAGNAYIGSWFVVRVDTAFVASVGAPQIQFQLQSATTEDFSGASPVTLAQSSAYLVADLTAGKWWAIRIPQGVKRYLRGYKYINNYAAQTIAVSSCKIDMFITADIPVQIQKRYML